MAMTEMSFEVFDALKSAGVPEDKARKAAEALSGANFRAALSDLKTEIVKIEGKLTLHSWMLGVIAAGIVTLVLRSFFSG